MTGTELLAIRKPVAALDPGDLARLLDRGRSTDPEVARSVAETVAAVRERGDAALLELAQRYDGVALEALEVPRDAWDAALAHLDPAVRSGLEGAAAAIARFHRLELPGRLEREVAPGLRLGRRPDPLGRVGVYAPGGRAAYASSVLMGVVPARVAGVREVVVCSPPGADGRVAPAVLAASALAGADRVFALGGAGAVAAMALGTATVPRVDRVVGPGNAYVAEAKRQLSGAAGMDAPAGPSEVLVLADASADPDRAALEMLAQAEHDPDAAAVLVALDGGLADAVVVALERLVAEAGRREIVEAALGAAGAVLTAADLDEAVAFAERYAPEHLLLLLEAPLPVLERVRSAGTVVLGNGASVAFGDYVTGANHVLPTAGLARFHSGLSVEDFLRWTTYQVIDDAAAATLAAPTAVLAAAEGLPAHGAAALAAARTGVAAGAAPAEAVAGEARAATSFTGPPARPGIRRLEVYDPRRGGVELDVSDNTNLFGTGPAAAVALATPEARAVARYPTPYADLLKEAAARYFDVAAENVTTGCGSDDLIDSAVRAYAGPGDTVAYQAPTFPMASIFAAMNEARAVAVPPGPDFALDDEDLLATGAAVTYLCRPNNPTGTLTDADAVRRVMREATGLVLVDEAYADYAGETMIPDALASDRAVVLRTMSKAFGLAGLRVGLAIGPAPLIIEIEKSRGPYKVGALAEAVAAAALDGDGDWVRHRVAEVRRERERMARAIAALGPMVWPSVANFLLIGLGDRPAMKVAGALRERGIGVRAFPDLPLAGSAIRITVGGAEVNDRVLDALEAVLA